MVAGFEELNNEIKSSFPTAYELLSDLGRRMYLPAGILVQSGQARAKAKKHNATIGVALKNPQAVMYLDSIMSQVDQFTPNEVVQYAPAQGVEALRDLWAERMKSYSPHLKEEFSRPIVTQAISHGLSIMADLFLDTGDPVVIPDLYWENYDLMFSRHRVKFESFPSFTKDDKFNIDGMLDTVRRVGKETGKAVLLLNFPTNPTGYTLTKDEVLYIAKGLQEIADGGVKILTICDDAYNTLFFEDYTVNESLFSFLNGISDNLLVVKLDGATKEAYSWGIRVGFITFGVGKTTDKARFFNAIDKKATGDIRSYISMASMLSQNLLLKALQKKDVFEKEVAANHSLIKERYIATKEHLSKHQQDYSKYMYFYPFNSGYFFTVNLKCGIDDNELRLHLLDKYETGVISLGKGNIRVAFAALPKEEVPHFFDCLYNACKDLAKN